jgi:RNA polymerase sigma-70 factor (ECF subfamily)
MHSRRTGAAIENIEGYLFSVAARVLLRYRMQARKTSAQVQSIEIDDAPTAEALSAERVFVGRDDLDRAVEALKQMPTRTREVFLLHRFEEKTYGAIAAQLGISVSAVEKHIMNALRTLKGKLEEGHDGR